MNTTEEYNVSPSALAVRIRSPILISERALTSPDSRSTVSDPAKQALVCVKLYPLGEAVGGCVVKGESAAFTFFAEGKAEGTGLGMLVGCKVGRKDGRSLRGGPLGTALGIDVGTALGIDVGTALGIDVGTALGIDVGTALGIDRKSVV